MNASVKSDVQVILIDIDALLDTRLAILYRLNPTYVNTNLNNKSYYKRISDEWSRLGEGIDQKEFEELYNNRDKSILAESTVTEMLPHLLHVISMYKEEVIYAPGKTGNIYIVVNLYPYDLTDEEKEQLILVLSHYIGEGIPVRIIELSPEETKLSKLVGLGFTQYILYDFIDWMQLHYKELNSDGGLEVFPSFQIIVPKRLRESLDTLNPDDMRAYKLDKQDPFELAKELFCTLFTMHILPLKVFSMFDVTAQLEE